MKQSDEVFVAAHQCLLTRVETVRTSRLRRTSREAYPECVRGEERDALESVFSRRSRKIMQNGWISQRDSDWLRQVGSLDNLRRWARSSASIRRISTQCFFRAAAGRIETERAEPEPEDDDERRWSGDSVVDDVHGMFDALEGQLRDT